MPGDPVARGQVVMSLMLNVREAMPAGGAFWVETARTDDRSPGVRLLLGTARPGTADAIREPLWEPFHTTKSNGTGLGLWITRGIVPTMRGRSSFVLRPAKARHGSSGCREATGPWLTRDGGRFPPAAHRGSSRDGRWSSADYCQLSLQPPWRRRTPSRERASRQIPPSATCATFSERMAKRSVRIRVAVADVDAVVRRTPPLVAPWRRGTR